LSRPPSPAHVDWDASHFFDNKLQLGVVGYYLQQVTNDFGARRRSAASGRESQASARK
jgi:hypothetical protein